MESLHVNGVRTTASYVQLEVAKRQNSSNYLAGMCRLIFKPTSKLTMTSRYAEVLENTQYALIATVHKLYSMVRNNETWDLGEPELNDRGQPVIHDVASRLGCIRPSPDLPYTFPEGPGDFADLQAQLQAARHELASEDTGSRKHSSDASSPPERMDRASSSESDHSNISKDYNQILWSQKQATKIAPQLKVQVTPLHIVSRQAFEESQYQPRISIDSACSMPSPVYTDYQTESPMFRNASPFAWAGGDEFLGQSHPLGMTSSYLSQQNTHRTSPLSLSNGDFDTFKAMQENDISNFSAGTIRPNMLDYSIGYNHGLPLDQMDSIVYNGGEYNM